MLYFMKVVHSFVNYPIFRELCDRMRFGVNHAKSHHRIISEGLLITLREWAMQDTVMLYVVIVNLTIVLTVSM